MYRKSGITQFPGSASPHHQLNKHPEINNIIFPICRRTHVDALHVSMCLCLHFGWFCLFCANILFILIEFDIGGCGNINSITRSCSNTFLLRFHDFVARIHHSHTMSVMPGTKIGLCTCSHQTPTACFR